MITLEHGVLIDRPIQQVFGFVANVENNPQWQSGVLDVRMSPDGPVGVGSVGVEVRRFMCWRIELTFEVTEYEENTKFSFKIPSGPMPVEGTEALGSTWRFGAKRMGCSDWRNLSLGGLRGD